MASTVQSLLRSTSPIQWRESELDNIASQIPIIQKVWKDKLKELEYQISQQAMWAYIAAFEPKLYDHFNGCFNGPDLLKARRIWKKKEKEFLPLILQAVEEFSSK